MTSPWLRHIPCDALLSVTMRSNGKAIEIAMIGDEGLSDCRFSSNVLSDDALVQVGGHASA